MDLLPALLTPHKHNALVLAPSYKAGAFDSHAVDCPFPFWHEDRFFMTFVGWDGIGYRTGLASSSDLVHWEKQRLLLDRGPAGSFTEFNVALTQILRQNDLYSPGELKKVHGGYLGTYHAYPRPGYETGPASIALCFSHDLVHWELGDPILRNGPPGAFDEWFCSDPCVCRHAGHWVMFYFGLCSDVHARDSAAISDDLLHWEKAHTIL